MENILKNIENFIINYINSIMIIAARKMVFQINDNEFETITDCKNFNDTATISELKEWFKEGNKSYHFYASPIVQIQFVEEK